MLAILASSSLADLVALGTGKEKYAAPITAAIVCLCLVLFLQSILLLLQASCIRLAGLASSLET